MPSLSTLRYGDFGHTSRLRIISHKSYSLTTAEFVSLLIAGALAATAVAFIPLQLRVPGHAILKAALPVVCGVALVPRRFAGTIAGTSAGLTAAAFLVCGVGNLQSAAVTALVAIGPAIDLAMRGAARGGWSLYLRFAVAGLVANLLAFVVRWGAAALALDGFRPRMMQQIGLGALISFAACGFLAGLLSGVICFRGRSQQP